MSPQLMAVSGLLGVALLVTVVRWRLSGTRVVGLIACLALAGAAALSAASALFQSPLWAAVFACLASGWREGIAITLALKGLGCYPELRHQEQPGIAERFLTGTFVSVLWAAACAGVVVLLSLG